MSNLDIKLDPGHGGKDPGAIAIGMNGLKEKDVNLELALRIGKLLTDRKLNVSYTRTTDKLLGNSIGEDLNKRVELANSVKPKYFISIHNNSFNEESNGTETYIYAKGGQAEMLAKAVQSNLVNTIGLYDRGVKTANFYVLKYTDMPAILVEVAFISNPEEELLLKDDIFIEKAAKGVSKGIMEFLKKEWIEDLGESTPSEWAKEAWEWGIKNGITDGSNPKALATRQETIAMIYRTINLIK